MRVGFVALDVELAFLKTDFFRKIWRWLWRCGVIPQWLSVGCCFFILLLNVCFYLLLFLSFVFLSLACSSLLVCLVFAVSDQRKLHDFVFQALKAAGQIWLLSNFDSQEDIAYPNDPRVPVKVDDDLKQLFRGIELPRDMIDIERDLQKNGMKPATNTAQRRARSEVHGLSSKPKPKKKKHEITKRTKLTNAHLPELFRNLDS